MSTVATAIATPADPPKKRGRGRPPKVKTDEASAAPPPAKRKRGRPPKAKPTSIVAPSVVTAPPLKIKRGRGRPRKEPIAAGAATATTTTTAAVKAPAKRGRPRKNPAPPPPVDEEPAPMPHKPLKLKRGRGRPSKHPKPEDDVVPKVTFVDSWQDMPFNEFSTMVQERFQTFSSDQQEQLVEQLQTILNTKAAAVQEEPATQTEQKESLTPKDEAEFFDAQEEVKV